MYPQIAPPHPSPPAHVKEGWNNYGHELTQESIPYSQKASIKFGEIAKNSENLILAKLKFGDCISAYDVILI